MLFFFTCIFWILAPGLLLRRFGPGNLKNPIFVPVASWVFLVVVFIVLRFSSPDVDNILYLLYSGLLVLALIYVLRFGLNLSDPVFRVKGDVLSGAAVVVGAYSLYYAWVGTYIEIPADVFSHLGKFQAEFDYIRDKGRLPGMEISGFSVQTEKHWYIIYAYLAFHTGARIEEIYHSISYINTTLILLAVYFTSLYVFRDVAMSRSAKICIAAATTLFFVLHFGVNVFSYVRYYALAPTITAYFIYLAFVIAAWEFYRGRLSRVSGLTVIGILALTGLILNLQEFIFIVITLWAMAVVVVGSKSRILANKGRDPAVPYWRMLMQESGTAAAVAVSGLVIATVVVVISYGLLERATPHRPWIAPLYEYVPFVNHLFILNPRYQVYHVFAVWGYIIYLLFILHIRDFKNNYLILAGMLIPFLTVFNPVFVDLYLRYQEAFTLYRMLYMVPFSFVGGYLLVKYFHNIVSKPNILQRAVSGVAVLVLAGALFPFDAIYAYNSYSRVYTLKATANENHPGYWEDLLVQLEGMKPSKIVTDPVTGYVVNGLTKHGVRTRKYRKVWIELDDQSYDDDVEMFKEFDGYVLIVNLRGGGLSKIGKISGHWPEDILKTSNLYSEGFVKFVKGNPDMFVPIWANRQISVYEIDYEGGARAL